MLWKCRLVILARERTLKNIPEEEIKISSQSYLKGFYEKNGFVAKGEEYLEDGIPHTAMYREK